MYEKAVIKGLGAWALGLRKFTHTAENLCVTPLLCASLCNWISKIYIPCNYNE
jgi:hypothetical protein